mmetsp:Transcript_10481/g.20715  ORF Transcript_10481/g.20715 Transcript_10481/m.20715 type:complete len:210 (+) Transcript_10481:1693-2322(+)
MEDRRTTVLFIQMQNIFDNKSNEFSNQYTQPNKYKNKFSFRGQSIVRCSTVLLGSCQGIRLSRGNMHRLFCCTFRTIGIFGIMRHLPSNVPFSIPSLFHVRNNSWSEHFSTHFLFCLQSGCFETLDSIHYTFTNILVFSGSTDVSVVSGNILYVARPRSSFRGILFFFLFFFQLGRASPTGWWCLRPARWDRMRRSGGSRWLVRIRRRW